MSSKNTVLDYYQNQNFNPVPISIGTKEKWIIHKRRELIFYKTIYVYQLIY